MRWRITASCGMSWSNTDEPRGAASAGFRLTGRAALRASKGLAIDVLSQGGVVGPFCAQAGLRPQDEEKPLGRKGLRPHAPQSAPQCSVRRRGWVRRRRGHRNRLCQCPFLIGPAPRGAGQQSSPPASGLPRVNPGGGAPDRARHVWRHRARGRRPKASCPRRVGHIAWSWSCPHLPKCDIPDRQRPLVGSAAR